MSSLLTGVLFAFVLVAFAALFASYFFGSETLNQQTISRGFLAISLLGFFTYLASAVFLTVISDVSGQFTNSASLAALVNYIYTTRVGIAISVAIYICGFCFRVFWNKEK